MEQVDTNRKKYGAQLYESTTDSTICCTKKIISCLMVTNRLYIKRNKLL